MNLLLYLFLSFINFDMNSQEKNYFYEIKKFDENYSNKAIVSRFVHSVGFRYYWATEGLRNEDLKYKPYDSGINTRETLEHIYGLSIMIHNGFHNKEIERSRSYPDLSYDELRQGTLDFLENTVILLENYSGDDFDNSKVIFGKQKYDIYNLDGDKIINSDEDIIYTNTTHTIMGYDVFKYKDVYLTTEDLYA